MVEQQDLHFYYKRHDNVILCIGQDVKKYPLTYTIEECLEDFCDEQGWNFNYMIYARFEEGRGSGQFSYYIEAKRDQQIGFCWDMWFSYRKISFNDGDSMSFIPSFSIHKCLKIYCQSRNWEYVNSGSYDTSNQGHGHLQYRE